ncbi:LacI family DNA-binding transcriptional regulator [Ammoniphilus sp. 3BR4]|uniref:LacI family DNA-binding transcriptional regulator n=1 Tax=Ammoniphilus sp. 3BR4 TaxID=3158265 RepID=UPI00346770AE
MSVTIKDLARILNVSHTTVSRALNNSPLISEKTKKKIQDMAKELNYVPNYNAKSLVQNRSYNIGLFFSTISQATSPHFFYETVRGINSIISEKYNLVVEGIDNYNDFTTIDTKRFDGIILMSQSENDNPFIYHVLEKGIPLVVLNREIADPSIVNILSADKKGAYEGVIHLIRNGHQNIALIEGKKGFHATVERKEGFFAALIEKAIPIRKEYIVQGDYTIESGYYAMKKLLEVKPAPTAIFCSNDEMAVGAMKAIFEVGLKIPDDISIVGFDDSPFSPFTTPSLTSVRRSISEVSKEGAKKLLSIIQGTDMHKGKIYIKPELIIRDSVKNNNFSTSERQV